MKLIPFAAVILLASNLLWSAPVSLFDGKSLDGWEVRKGEETLWKVSDGMLTGGSLTDKVPYNTFLASRKSYRNFDLTYKIRLVKGDGFMNSGMQIRSERKPDDHEMVGYQVDAGSGYWGDIYDESRRNVAVAKAPSTTADDWGWNEFRILCEGPRIRTWINGKPAVDYTEKDPAIPANGRLGLQVHGGGKLLVQLKDIFITELPATDGPLSAGEEHAGFTLAPGFSAELVASEEQGVGKAVTVAWDKQGRMWTMTALEYPVDANENEAIARELFKRGGKDKVLVFDEPNGPGPQTPRTFAEGLAIPLGILPEDNSVLVQHGQEIRRYRDDDGDGKADGFEVLLKGFGIQDSHLFPHQFERAPGGWIYLAQGAFNSSKVHRPGGLKFDDGSETVEFNNCKLGRFRPDGSAFEPLTGGPNNIWGLVIDRKGETFVQEANDLGYPVAEFAPGTHYPTGFGNKLRNDAPVLPQSTPDERMGGTGLSGLALAEDTDSPFAAGHGDKAVFYVANPITSRIQIITMTYDASGHPVYRKGPDFMTSADSSFRPVSIHFGPDGCLYVVDWYNKIISHNEVPRAHPDRDKTHGRIWRIRHENQSPAPRVDLTKLPDADLLGFLGGKSALIASRAWQEIVDRKATALVPGLAGTLTDPAIPLPRRMGALWALEGLGEINPALLVQLAKAPEPSLRHEAVRIAGAISLPEPDFLAVISALGNEPNYRVRAAIANAVRDHRKPTAGIMACAASLGLEPLAGPDRASYDRTFERYLARWAMSENPDATRRMLFEIELPVEARLLAIRSFDGDRAAADVLALLPEMKRDLTTEEFSLLVTSLNSPPVLRAISTLFNDPGRREATLRAMLRIEADPAMTGVLGQKIEDACFTLLKEGRTDETELLVVRLARKFHRTALSGEVEKWMRAPGRSHADLAEGLATIRQIGVINSSAFLPDLNHPDEAVRREALMGFANSDDTDTVIAELAKRWPSMAGVSRALVVDTVTSSSHGPAAFAKALAAGKFPGFDGTAVEKLIAALGADHPDVKAMLEANEGLLRPVLRFGNVGPGRWITDTTLAGPFTVETWIKLPAPIDNTDAIIGSKGGPDINFAGGRLRVYGGNDVGDLIIADRPIEADRWTHCAITRDARGRFQLYLDGEPDTAQGKEFTGPFTGFNLGESHQGLATMGGFDEVRIWNSARSASDIRRDFRSRFAEAPLPEGLVLRIAGDHPVGSPEGSARIELVMDFPALVSSAEAAALDEKFRRFRSMAETEGDPANGKLLVTATCMICHQIQGEGTAIGPNLSGAGAMGVESLLRNILTPNAQLESGYYRHDLKLKDGSVTSGFLVKEDDRTLTLRVIGADEKVVSRDALISHEISKRSLMPEGLIDGFSEKQVADLFSYLNTLR